MVGQVGGRTKAVAVQGNYAYVGVGLRLIVLDVSDRTAPKEIGSTAPFLQFVEGVAVSGTVAYVVAGRAGLRTVDISDPAHPVELGAYDTPGYAEAVLVSGQYAYIADGPYGLRVVDISDSVHPVEISFAYPLNYVLDVAVDGQYAYLAAGGAGLLVVDVSDPAHPSELGSYDTRGYAYGVKAAQRMAYIADGWEGLRIVDVSDPARPVEVGSYNTPGWAFGVDIVGSTAYVADAFRGLRVLNVSNPTRPVELGGYEALGGHAGKVVVAGDTAYVADRNWGLRVVDVSSPRSPTQVGFYGPPGHAVAVAVSGNYAYVAAATYGLRVVDISDPARPVEVGAYDTQGNAIGVAVVGNYAYVAVMCPEVGAGLHVVDISDPAHPTKVGYVQQVVGCYRDIVVANGIAYVANEWGLELIDVSSPYTPVLAGYINLQGEGLNATTGVDVSGTLAYVAGQGGLYVIDVSSSVSPTLISTFKDSQWVAGFDVAVAGSKAFVTHHGGESLKIIDVSDPAQPTQLGAYTAQNSPERVIVVNTTAYVAFGSGGLHGIDVTDPSSPTLALSYDTSGYTTASAKTGNYTYVADAQGGMLILLETGGAQSRASRRTWTKPASVVPALGEGTLRQPRILDTREKTSLLQHGRNGIREQVQFPSHHKLAYQPTASLRRITGTCMVTSTADSGPGTLRECMESAVSGDTITFDPAVFPPETPATIALQADLPPISSGNLTIDASDAGVILDGNGLGRQGLTISSDNNVVRGLRITNFSWAGAHICCGAMTNVIGGNRTRGRGPAGQGNVISGNGLIGVSIAETGTMHNIVIGNLIGTDAGGTSALGNGFEGVSIYDGASHNRIGSLSPGTSNIISANGGPGVHITDNAAHNVAVGNYIGTDINGTSDLGNGSSGVLLELGALHNLVRGNLISGSNSGGVVITDWGSSYNIVVGNLIGTDASGVQGLGNRWTGVAVGFGGAHFNRIGGTSPEDANVISGNPLGVELHGGEAGNLIHGNLIGTNVNGTQAIGNDVGIKVVDDSSYNFIGGTTAAEGNLISGNGSAGIAVDPAERIFILGNYIGIDAGGLVPLANGGSGIISSCASNGVIQGNFVSGNNEAGVRIDCGGGFNLRANRIGLAVDEISPLPNGTAGVRIEAASNTTGGPYPADGNVIAFNGGSGIEVWTHPGNAIRRNAIYSNSGSGIYLANGGNDSLAAPIITQVLPGSVSGAACSGCTVEIFSDAEDEGRTYEGSAIVDTSGNWTWVGEATGPYVTTTATDKTGNTSAFSSLKAVRTSAGGGLRMK